MKKDYCTPEIVIRNYDLCEEISESGGENPGKKEEDDNAGKRNTLFTILQCAILLDKYYERARDLDNENKNVLAFDSEDLKKWQECYYPALVESKRILNGDYFDERNPEMYGILKNGTFTKLGFCHFAYRCYEVLIEMVEIAPSYAKLYDFCCSMKGNVEHFKGNAYDCSEQVRMKESDLWQQEYYVKYSKTERIDDASFFKGSSSDPNFGIGADGLFNKHELIHFLYRALRYIYDFHATYADKIYAGVNLSETFNSTFYDTSDDGNIACIYFFDAMYSEIEYREAVEGVQREYILWEYKNGDFEGNAEKTRNVFKLLTSNYKLDRIVPQNDPQSRGQKLNLRGHLLDYWVGNYVNNEKSIQVKDLNTIVWRDHTIIDFIYFEETDSFEIFEDTVDKKIFSGCFKLIDQKMNLDLSFENIRTKKITTERYVKEVALETPRSFLSIKQDADKLSLCVLCNQYYHLVHCYISFDQNIKNGEFLQEIPQQGTVNLYLPSGALLYFVTGENLISSYQVQEHKNYLLLGVGQDFDDGCSVRDGDYSYFSLKTRLGYSPYPMFPENETENKRAAQLMNIREQDYHFFRLYTSAKSHFLIIKYEDIITNLTEKAAITVLDPKGKIQPLSQMLGFSPYVENNGGVCILDTNIPIGEWVIAIAKNESIEIAVTGQVIPIIENDTDGQLLHDMIIKALGPIYDSPEDKYAELFSPFRGVETGERETKSSSNRLQCFFLSQFTAQGTPLAFQTVAGAAASAGVIAGVVAIVAVSAACYYYYKRHRSIIDEMIALYEDIESVCAKDKNFVDECVTYQKGALTYRNTIYDQYVQHQTLSAWTQAIPSLTLSGSSPALIKIRKEVVAVDAAIKNLFAKCTSRNVAMVDFNNVENAIKKVLDDYDPIEEKLKARKKAKFQSDAIMQYYNHKIQTGVNELFYNFCEICKGGLFKLAAERINKVSGLEVKTNTALNFNAGDLGFRNGEANKSYIGINFNQIVNVDPTTKNHTITNHHMINGQWGYGSYADKIPFATIIHEFQHFVFLNCIEDKYNLLPLINEGLSEFIVGHKRIRDWNDLEKILINFKNNKALYSAFSGKNEEYIVAQFFISYLYNYDRNNKDLLKTFLGKLKNNPNLDSAFIENACSTTYGQDISRMFENFLNLPKTDYVLAFGDLDFRDKAIPMYCSCDLLQKDLSNIVPKPILLLGDKVSLDHNLEIIVDWQINNAPLSTKLFVDAFATYEFIDPLYIKPHTNVYMSDIEHHAKQQKMKWLLKRRP